MNINKNDTAVVFIDPRDEERIFKAEKENYQPPTLIVRGKNDQIFPAAGAESYKRDLKALEFHLLDTGHFALEEDGDKIADLMRNFLRRNVKR